MAVARPPRSKSSSVQTASVAAGASMVFTNASAAIGVAPRALPALNPNHPNQRSPAPSNVNGTLWGSIACRA